MHPTPAGGRWLPVADAAMAVLGSVALGMILTARYAHTGGAGVVAVAFGLVVPTLAAVSILGRGRPAPSQADRVTLIRGVLVGGCATLVVLSLSGDVPLRSWPLFALALPSFLLDGVDGWVARRMGTPSAAGGRLDMETDAAFLMILSVPLSLAVGPWVLGIGAMRYLFLAAGWWRPALLATLAFSSFRRIVAGIQGGVLVVALLPVLPAVVAAAATALSLGLLVISFGRDVVTLEGASRKVPSTRWNRDGRTSQRRAKPHG